MAWSIFSQPGDAPKAWAQDLLSLIGAPRTPGNVQFVYDWEKSEGGGGKFNPLNQGPVPGQPGLTTTGSQFGGGAADFASWSAGLQGASDYLHMPNFQPILNNLKANNPVGARSALIASPWAASHYGGGSAFSNAPVPGGKASLPGVTASLTSAPGGALNPSNWPSELLGGIAQSAGAKSTQDFLIRTGLIVLGGLLLIVAVVVLAGRSAAQTAITLAAPEAKGAEAASGGARAARATAKGT